MTADTSADPTADPTAQPATTAPVSPLLARPAAVPAEGSDAGVAWHYGDPNREQRLLATGAAVTDLSHRGVLTVTGPDRLSWLHSLTTQSLTGLPAGEGVESLVLSPHGHVEHALHVVDDGVTVWLTVEPGTAPALVDWLRRMQFMLRVEVADVTAAWAVLGLVAAAGATLPAGLRVPDDAPPAWQDPWPRLGATSASYAAVPDDEHPGLERPWREVLVPRESLDAVVGDTPLAGSWASEALRVAAWRPRLGHESDHRTIPHEDDWLRTAVHLQKGCYRGQETVARVHNLGRPPRRLVLLHLDGSEHALPAAGAAVVHGGRQVGFVTTSARHHELGPVALALVKRSLPVDATLAVSLAGADGVPAVPGSVDAEVDAGSLAASQEVIVRP
ncbi:MAG: folate-binding protein YgfZ [Actinobacteria bacterium]|nr:folate-binding protein YgfZ [Actinomycetota bacterium]